MFEESRPIFLQIADGIASDVLRGVYEPGDQVPSTNELAAFHRINPATAGKALGRLVDLGILEKRRGLGMFVTPEAKGLIASERHSAFVTKYVIPMVSEAQALGIDTEQLMTLINKEANNVHRN